MTRKELEDKLKAAGRKTIVIVINETDPLGVGCELKSGILYDEYTGRRIDRKANIWGYIRYIDGKPVRFPFKS